MINQSMSRSVNSICLPEKIIINRKNELALVSGYGYINRTTDLFDSFGKLPMGWIEIDASDADYTANYILTSMINLTGTFVCKVSLYYNNME